MEGGAGEFHVYPHLQGCPNWGHPSHQRANATNTGKDVFWVLRTPWVTRVFWQGWAALGGWSGPTADVGASFQASFVGSALQLEAQLAMRWPCLPFGEGEKNIFLKLPWETGMKVRSSAFYRYPFFRCFCKQAGCLHRPIIVTVLPWPETSPRSTEHLDYTLVAQSTVVFCGRFFDHIFTKSPNEAVGIDGLCQNKHLQPCSFEPVLCSSHSLLILSSVLWFLYF